VKLPEEIIIAQERLSRYLLLPREENDKSKFLATAGYTVANWEVLERDLRELAKSQEISELEISPYDIKYVIRGTLNGPNGERLRVVTVWMALETIGETRFVTVFPDKEVE
jgi:hypothetical protein